MYNHLFNMQGFRDKNQYIWPVFFGDDEYVAMIPYALNQGKPLVAEKMESHNETVALLWEKINSWIDENDPLSY